ncbi:MAG: phosphotransferase [Candidatus Shapirobacteria bacterium]|jgi:thiamine kinase-like enzyme
MLRDEEIIEELKIRWREVDDTQPRKFDRLSGGMNNHLYQVTNTENTRYLLKIYVVDETDRLSREFKACSYLWLHNFPVPKPIFKNDIKNYAIYTFAEGGPKKAQMVTKDDIDKMVDFLTALENCRPDYYFFDKSASSFTRLSDYVNYVEKRLDTLKTSLINDAIDDRVDEFLKRTKLITFIEDEKRKICSSIYSDEWNRELNIDQQVLSPLDFGPHNALFAADGNVTFIDFEKFGWDDPTHVVVSFVNHIQTIGLRYEYKQYFLKKYFEKSSYSGLVKERLPKIIQIDRLGWIAFLANTLTPDRLRHYLDAQPQLGKDEYVERQLYEIEIMLGELAKKLD